MENSTPCKFVTRENFILKLGTHEKFLFGTSRALGIITAVYYIQGP